MRSHAFESLHKGFEKQKPLFEENNYKKQKIYLSQIHIKIPKHI